MSEQLAARIKEIIVETLALEDIEPTSIVTDAPLFGEGLGLDSIDALELALAFHKEFGVRTQENDENNREYYRSVATLVKFISEKQAEASSESAAT
jgi:acyl carrier protein